MRSRLYDAFSEALAAGPETEGALPATAIPGRLRDYVCASRHKQPVLLLSCGSAVALKRPPITLQHLTVEFGVRFRVSTPTGVVADDFVVISLRGHEGDLAEAFCVAADALIAALSDAPSASEIERVVRDFVEVLSALSLPSSRTVAGLWAELWLMSLSSDREAAVMAWHRDATDRFDFSFDEYLVEVKATELAERNHDFAYEQIRGAQSPVMVASVILCRSQTGSSVADLVSELYDGLGPTLRSKLVKNVFGAIGSAVSEASDIRFDKAAAGASLRVIAGSRVPAVMILDGSPISAVRFRVNLGDSALAPHLVAPATQDMLRWRP